MHLSQGTLLRGGTYRIEKTLGQGSFGITYLATHTTLDKKVAIKEFFMKELNSRDDDGSITGMTDGSLSANYGQKFKKEAVNLSRLEHPNIVRVTDSFDENGTYYYVMDYIEGENLNDYLKHNSLSHEDAVSIIKDVASALMYMHDEKHMLHLDLKPSNIMRRSSDGHIFLIDFGLSKHYSNDGQPETSTTIGLGTPGYAPIEQSNQNKSGEFRPTIDVYALGATLFKLLTGETPPPASDIVSDDELVEMKLRANGITGSIVDIVVNAMLPNVRKRTQTVKAFVDSLSSGVSDNSVSASTKTANNNEETLVATAPSSRVNNEETVVMGSGVSNHQNFDEALYKIDAKYRNFVTSTRNSAGNGDCDAMLALGMMYLRGDGLSQDFTRAYCLFQDMKRINEWEQLMSKYKKAEANVAYNNTQNANTTSVSHTSDSTLKQGCLAWFVIIILFIIFLIAAMNSGSSSSYGYDSDCYDCDSDTVVIEDTLACDTVVSEYMELSVEEKITYKTYYNERFHFSIDYPDFLTPMPSSQNDDGRTFEKNSQTYMKAYASWATETLEDYYNMCKSSTDSYKQLGTDWFVVSGIKSGGTIYHQKTVLLNDVFYTVYFSYHTSESAQFDDIIRNVIASWKYD